MVAQIDKTMVAKRKGKLPGRLIAWSLIEGREVTSTGQWVNPLVFALYRAADLFPARIGSDAPIYIIGTGRSGTTILGKLFALHKETVFLNEPKSAWHHVVGGEDVIGTYSMGPGRFRLTEGDADPAFARKLAKIYSWAMRWGMAKRVVDKYPELLFRVPFVEKLFPNARFLLIIRDGVDTCASVTGFSRKCTVLRSNEVHDWWGRDSRKWNLLVEQMVPEHPDLAPLQDTLRSVTEQNDRAAVEWMVTVGETQKLMESHSDTVMVVRYEELCNQPAETATRMARHCGLSDDTVYTEYATEILSLPRPYDQIQLMPELVEPFCNALASMGYGVSRARVVARA